ncbi:permease-like cell division protein FtsX [Defluviitalea raffinosedens]|uniref:Cell division protein FtsX n=1 Tax=Defluviitalea raffinosedens TaxID=1450156 RepID=A0A7C8LFD5_9FIRM|nr:permease-like cell division protein FtsX [Defluviitalea raffinosedens]KAE9635503.1 FtsX-like permease family protein [Defluviitalea raffinosedens]MBM7684413.1 cell division transport system permease protein [Defluviitalea raffinosedens]MBZ4667507.1 ftsX [Defluviitaleaceae bacterium]HHW68480.1 ABC transporter permease [Candidatus Epulonipiscium sp.]
MKIRTMKYFVGQGFRGIWRNRLMSLASIGTIASCLMIVGIFYCIAVNVDYILETLEETAGITVFCTDEEVSEDKIRDLEERIRKIDHIDEVVYISPEEALNKEKEEWGEYGSLLDGLENDNPLPPSFEITLDDIRYQKEVVAELNQLSGIEIRYLEEETKILIGFNNMIRLISLVLILVLGFIGVMLMDNTIRLTVYIRKNEINIMKYIGATNWFIRWPFVIEGIIIGIIGSVLPLVLIWFSYNFITELIYEKNTFIRNVLVFRTPGEIFNVLTPISLIIGIGIGVIGSTISIRRYLKV